MVHFFKPIYSIFPWWSVFFFPTKEKKGFFFTTEKKIQSKLLIILKVITYMKCSYICPTTYGVSTSIQNMFVSNIKYCQEFTKAHQLCFYFLLFQNSKLRPINHDIKYKSSILAI